MPDTRANTRSTCKTTLRVGIKNPLSELHELGLPHEIGLVQAREVDPGRESLACEIAADDEREALAVVPCQGTATRRPRRSNTSSTPSSWSRATRPSRRAPLAS